MIFDTPPSSAPKAQAQQAGIFTRIMSAANTARAVRQLGGKLLIAHSASVFLGEDEWTELCDLCATFGVEWRGGDENYNPVSREDTRAEFSGLKIYRVDAKTFLAAL